MHIVASLAVVVCGLSFALAAPARRTAQQNLDARKYDGYLDIQGHRGARGEVVEQTMPAWARGLISGIKVGELFSAGG